MIFEFKNELLEAYKIVDVARHIVRTRVFILQSAAESKIQDAELQFIRRFR